MRLFRRAEQSRLLLIRRQPDPTDDIYVVGPLAGASSNGKPPMRILDFERPWRESALDDVDTVIVSRYISPTLLSALRARRDRIRRIVYLFDDDLAVAAQCEALPEAYRRWIADFAEDLFPQIFELADTRVVTSRELERRYAGPETRLLAPVLYAPAARAPLAHHAPGGRIELLYAGSTTHRADLAMISPALLAALAAAPQTRLTIVGCEPDAALRGHPRVRWMRQRPWVNFKRWIARRRVHVLLAPMQSHPWNACKSIIKLIDAAILGAVPVCSRITPYCDTIEDGRHGRLIGEDVDAWRASLLELIEDASGRQRMATELAALMQQEANPARAAAFWRDLI